MFENFDSYDSPVPSPGEKQILLDSVVRAQSKVVPRKQCGSEAHCRTVRLGAVLLIRELMIAKSQSHALIAGGSRQLLQYGMFMLDVTAVNLPEGIKVVQQYYLAKGKGRNHCWFIQVLEIGRSLLSGPRCKIINWRKRKKISN